MGDGEKEALIMCVKLRKGLVTDKMLMVKIWKKDWSGEISDILTFPASSLPLPTKKTWSILYRH